MPPTSSSSTSPPAFPTTDEEATQHKKARITIVRVMVHNRLDFWIKEKVLYLWIEQFLLEDVAICMRKCAPNVLNGTGARSGVS